MKRYLKLKYLPLVILACAVVTSLLRTLLFVSGIGGDGNGLLPTGSWPDVLSWITVALTMGLLGAATWKLRGANKYSLNFPASPVAAIAMVLAAVGFLITSVTDLSVSTDAISAAAIAMGFVSTAALLLLAYLRFRGQRPNMLLHTSVCLYLMLYLVSHYRLWSSAPQLQSYAFELLAIVFVMLGCYHRTAFDTGKGDRRAYTFFSLAAVYFCIATLPGCDNPAFFIGCAAWMFFTPCRLTLPARKED